MIAEVRDALVARLFPSEWIEYSSLSFYPRTETPEKERIARPGTGMP
jgi:hypothetical protein